MLAAASGGVIQAAHVDWYVNGGDLATKVSEAFGVLEQFGIDRGLGGGLTSGEPLDGDSA